MAVVAPDTLFLGPIAFTNFSPPERMPFGGRQAMAVHKLIGGRRVIDTLGTDDIDIRWSGFFFDANAFAICQGLDSLRIAGQVLPLSWAGMSYLVVISEFVAEVERLPNYIHYHICCVVSTDGASGALSSFPTTSDDLVSSDLSAATTLSSSPGVVTVPQNAQGFGIGPV